MNDDAFTGSAEQLQALHQALLEISRSKVLTINGLLTDVSRITKSEVCTPATIYRFIQKEENKVTLRYDIAAPIYNFLRVSVKYRTSRLSVFNLGRESVEHSMYYELRNYYSEQDTNIGRASDVRMYNDYLAGNYSLFKRPWMLSPKDRSSYILITDFLLSTEAGGNVLGVRETQKYDGSYGGFSPIRETDKGYAIGFGRSLLMILRSTRGATATFYIASELTPEPSTDAQASTLRGTVISNKGWLPHSGVRFVAKRLDSRFEPGVYSEHDLILDKRVSDVLEYL